MRQGENLLELARKEYCIALGGQQLRTKFRITDYKIYRVYPNGESNTCIRLMASSEKVNAGRPKLNYVDRNIGSNQDPAKFSSETPYGETGAVKALASKLKVSGQYP